MDAIDFEILARACSPNVHVITMAAIAKTESSYNPFAIGVVGGQLARQPRNISEAVATAKALKAGGWNFSMGLMQVNLHNLSKYGLNLVTVFDRCKNMNAGGAILSDCYARAYGTKSGRDRQHALHSALSCYYSGNFITGYRLGYVATVVANADKPIGVVRRR
jgi:type IV secretion system protein VirB1